MQQFFLDNLPMKAKFSPAVQKYLFRLQKKDKVLFLQIQKQITLFESNPRHPSLRLHALGGELEALWSISITRSIRMIYRQLAEDIAYFTKIGTHEEVYDK